MRKKIYSILSVAMLAAPEYCCCATSAGGILDSIVGRITTFANSSTANSIKSSNLFKTATSVGQNITNSLVSRGKDEILVQSVKKLHMLDGAEDSCTELANALNTEIQRLNELIVKIDQEPSQAGAALAERNIKLGTIDGQLNALYQELQTTTDVNRKIELNTGSYQLTQQKNQLIYEIDVLTKRSTELTERQAEILEFRKQYVMAQQTYINVLPIVLQFKQNITQTKSILDTDNGTNNTSQYLKMLGDSIPGYTKSIIENITNAQNLMIGTPGGTTLNQAYSPQQQNYDQYYNISQTNAGLGANPENFNSIMQYTTTAYQAVANLNVTKENFSSTIKSLEDHLVNLLKTQGEQLQKTISNAQIPIGYNNSQATQSQGSVAN
ncbi:MAG: hypothetical protein LBJ45_00485 [Holosporaceae bacterium]|jgi:hypothetical protein|nr:hypothetical protein [Holosporaceae bacterium]